MERDRYTLICDNGYNGIHFLFAVNIVLAKNKNKKKKKKETPCALVNKRLPLIYAADRWEGVQGRSWLLKSPKFTLTSALTGREHSRSPFFACDEFTVQLPVCGHTWRNVAARGSEREKTGY